MDRREGGEGRNVKRRGCGRREKGGARVRRKGRVGGMEEGKRDGFCCERF